MAPLRAFSSRIWMRKGTNPMGREEMRIKMYLNHMPLATLRQCLASDGRKPAQQEVVAMADFKAEWPVREAAHSNGRSALLIRCSDREASLIRAEATHERRTLSGYVLNAVMERMIRQNQQSHRPHPLLAKGAE
jgi:hypothetical protein